MILKKCSQATIHPSGESKIRKSALRKVSDYYQEVAWGAVSSILDHVVLWWSPEALAARHSQGARHLKDWLHQFIQGRNGIAQHEKLITI